MISPQLFQYFAITLNEYRWHFFMWAAFCFCLFFSLLNFISASTPLILLWLVILCLTLGFQLLIIAAFIMFFRNLPSNNAAEQQWLTLYRTVEWCEAILFSFMLPMPLLLLAYTFVSI